MREIGSRSSQSEGKIGGQLEKRGRRLGREAETVDGVGQHHSRQNQGREESRKC